MNSLLLLAGAILAFLAGMFFNRNKSVTDAKILDLTNKINNNKNDAAIKGANADAKTKDYLDALKKYDPNFSNDDDPSGKPSA